MMGNYDVDYYLMEFYGDLPQTHKQYCMKPRRFDSIADALNWLVAVGIDPDVEDDRIVIREVLESGHSKPVWHFSGWHWSQDGDDLLPEGIGQGCLLGHTRTWYEELMEEY